MSTRLPHPLLYAANNLVHDIRAARIHSVLIVSSTDNAGNTTSRARHGRRHYTQHTCNRTSVRAQHATDTPHYNHRPAPGGPSRSWGLAVLHHELEPRRVLSAHQTLAIVRRDGAGSKGILDTHDAVARRELWLLTVLVVQDLAHGAQELLIRLIRLLLCVHKWVSSSRLYDEAGERPRTER